MKTWQKPTPEQVERVVRKLGRPAAHRYFFSGLNNPEWIEPLKKRGFFDSAPAAIRDEDRGTVLLPDWPAARYLARVAPERPDLVAKIVGQIPDTDNEEFYGELVEIALRLPADLSASISRRLLRQKKIKNWSLSRAHLLARLIAHLAESDQETAAFRLATNLFGKRLTDDASPAARPNEKTQLEIWEYTEALKACLPSLVKANTVRSIAFLCTLIEMALIDEGLLKDATPQTLDMSAFRSREIGDPDESMALGLSDILAKRLCATGIEAIRTDAGKAVGIIDAIEKKKWELFRVLALYILAQVAPVAPEAAKARMLDADLFYQSHYATEYSSLLLKRFGELSSEEQTIILDRIRSGPDVETAAANYTKFGGQAPPAETLDMYRKGWLRDRLLWIPETYRSSELQSQLSTLIAEIGPPEPALPITVSGFYGATSPKTEEEFAVMSPSEILAYFRAWTPLDDPQKSPSRSGLARQLQSAVREKPFNFANLAHEFVGLPPIYIRHFFWGLDEALTKGHRGLNWSRITELGAWMVSQPRGQELGFFPLPGR